MQGCEQVRHLARLGRPAGLGALLGDTDEGDGFGVGWFSEPEFGRPAGAPLRYRRAVGLRADTGFAALSRSVESGCALAAVRSSPPGAPADESAVPPHLVGGVLVSCAVEGADVPAAVGRLVPSTALAAVGATVPGAFVVALVGARLAAGDPLPDAVRAACQLVRDRAPRARLSLLAVDGGCLVGVAAGAPLVLAVGAGAVELGSGVDGPGATPVPDGSLVTATLSGVETTPL